MDQQFILFTKALTRIVLFHAVIIGHDTGYFYEQTDTAR